MKNTLQVGQKVHIDTDNKEWGRVASDATVISTHRLDALLEVESIRANILVRYRDIDVREKHV
jgi:hypothetical protein